MKRKTFAFIWIIVCCFVMGGALLSWMEFRGIDFGFLLIAVACSVLLLNINTVINNL